MKHICVLITFLTLLGCATPTPPARSSLSAPPLPEEEQAVLEVVLEHTEYKPMRSDGIYVIKNIASLNGLYFYGDLDEIAKSLRAEAPLESPSLRSAVEDLIRKNASETELTLSADRFPRVRLISRERIRAIFAHELEGPPSDWDIFYQQYPGAEELITISRPGISADGSTAIIYCDRQSDPDNGAGRFWILERRNGNWVLTTRSIGPSWVS